MKTSKKFHSTWSTGLKLMTILAIGVLAFVSYQVPRATTFALVAGVLVVSAAFMVRSLEVAGNQLVINRLGWSKRIDLTSLKGATVAPEAMSGSLRIFGIGGLFSYVGLFRNGRLGWYHAYATDPGRAVVLKFVDTTVVVTPEDPQGFVEAVHGFARA
jgi:hypothetical protein